MQRIQDVANIYGGIAGAMPGSPSQSFQPTPWVTGLGGGMAAADMMGMFGSQNQAAGQITTPYQNPYLPRGVSPSDAPGTPF